MRIGDDEMTYYKVLSLDGTSCNGGTYKWSLPRNGQPGEWAALITDIEPCKRGYHVCERGQLVQWLGPVIYECEVAVGFIEQKDKCVVRQARLVRLIGNWNDRTARLFACDCADEALKLVKQPDPRSIEAVQMARLFAAGEASLEQLAAARDAAWAAAWDAAWAAAWDAARAAARAAARTWQTARLFKYLEGEL